MKNIFYRREGQIAPLMIAVIVILIMAIMVTVNIGKVGLTKTHTANAADAGALAGSTMHANTLNSLADTNTAMIADYLSTEILFLLPLTICIRMMRYIAYLAFIAAQTTQYVLAWQNGADGYESARSAAYQFAFMNAGIDEAKPRLSGESYEAYLKRESNFGQWMKGEGYESGQYTWTDKNGKQNSFTVDVDAPDFPGLIPMPMVLTGLYLDIIWCIPPPVCPGAIGAYMACDAAASSSLLGEVKLLNTSTISCCAWMWNFRIYLVPIAWIAGIAKDNPQLTVTATRIEPNADLGLREMKYGSISSSAHSEAAGGSVGPGPSPSYDSYLIPGGN
ncbi:MAG: pilus assembly protein TadG-related protein [Candidatus Omnitrophica bacterium]|nr:pilus assembly protein TadG-related protein [Candidatus Omnitrophota bacterium]